MIFIKKLNMPIIPYQFKGFTLAEVLITLGVIGVVAALTLPALNNKIQEMQFISAWKKNYSAFNQATAKIMQDNGGNMADLSCSETANSVNCLTNKYKEQLDSTKTCAVHAPWGECFHPLADNYFETVKWLNGLSHIYFNTYPFSCSSSAGLVLKDGTLVLTNYQDTNCASGSGASVEGLSNVCGWLTIDINGFKMPNTVGKDIYIMLMLKNGLKPAGIGTLAGRCTPTSDGRGCAAKYLYE